jgi:hypothetical protein
MGARERLWVWHLGRGRKQVCLSGQVRMAKNPSVPSLRDGLAAARRCLGRTPGSVYALTLLVPVLAMAAALWAGLAPTDMLRDPIMVAGGDQSEFYLGLFSNLGVVLWTATAAICLFAASELTGAQNLQARHFLLYAGLFTMLLMLDDLFMLHENYADDVVYIFYGIGLVYYVARYWRLIMRLDVVLFALTLPLFGNAVLLDLAPWRLLPGEGIEIPEAMASSPSERADLRHLGRELRYLLEDGFKFVGICCWAGFHIRAAKLLRQGNAPYVTNA